MTKRLIEEDKTQKGKLYLTDLYTTFWVGQLQRSLSSHRKKKMYSHNLGKRKNKVFFPFLILLSGVEKTRMHVASL